jgi:flavin reductase (DIM6/NTAB) family NADH-FMN oxidoreductase RutF
MSRNEKSWQPPTEVNLRKTAWEPGTLLAPVPVVMVTCQSAAGRRNIVTVAWTGTVCSTPPMVGISLTPERFSHSMIQETGEFVINLPSTLQAKATDLCGVISGRDKDKFRLTGLTPVPAKEVRPPLIAECPVHLECKVRQSLSLGSHTLFLAEVVAVQIAERLITGKGRFAVERADLMAFAHGQYFALGKVLGHFGFSIKGQNPTAKG